MVLVSPRTEAVMSDRSAADADIGPLARILKRLRREHGLTQKKVVARARWADQGYYSRLESGEIRRPGDDKLKDLDRAFELEPDTLKYWLQHGPPWAVREQSPAYDANPAWERIDDGETIHVVWPRLSPERIRQLNDYAKWLAEQDAEQDSAS